MVSGVGKRNFDSCELGSTHDPCPSIRPIIQLAKRSRIVFEDEPNRMDVDNSSQQTPVLRERVCQNLRRSPLCIGNGFSSAEEVAALLTQKIYSNRAKACLVADALIHEGSASLILNGYELEFTTSKRQPIDDPNDQFQISHTNLSVIVDIAHKNTWYQAAADVSKFV